MVATLNKVKSRILFLLMLWAIIFQLVLAIGCAFDVLLPTILNDTVTRAALMTAILVPTISLLLVPKLCGLMNIEVTQKTKKDKL